jgi:DNA polymerase-1
MVMSFDLDAGRSEEGIGGGHGMDELAQRHLGHTCISFKEVCGTGKKAISFAEVPLDRATHYAAEDADVTWRLHRLLKPAFRRGRHAHLRAGGPPAGGGGGGHGAPRHQGGPREAGGPSQQFAEAIAALEGEIHAWRAPFTIGSPKQLGEILFDQMGLKGGKKGKSGQYSTDQSVLEKLEGEGVPIARKVLEWRQLAKLRSTYTEALQAAISPVTGRVHTSYSLVGHKRGACRPRSPTCRTSPSAPKSAARSAIALWPRRAMCCFRPTTARSSCALPRIWPMCPR